MGSLKSPGRSLGKALSLALVALVALASTLYLQLRDASASLGECREALASARSHLETLGSYAQGLHANCTKLREFAELLLANYTSLAEAYNALRLEYESAVRSRDEYRGLYEELHSSYAELRARYDNVTRQLEVLEELVGLVTLLRLYHLAGRVVGFEEVNGSPAWILENVTRPLRLLWSRAVYVFVEGWPYSLWFAPTINVPTPEPGYLAINFTLLRVEAGCEVCVGVYVTNTHLVPGRYVAKDEYFSVVICTRGETREITIPVFPHATVLRFRLISVAPEACQPPINVALTAHVGLRYLSLREGP